jgi:hypothetical protein
MSRVNARDNPLLSTEASDSVDPPAPPRRAVGAPSGLSAMASPASMRIARHAASAIERCLRLRLRMGRLALLSVASPPPSPAPAGGHSSVGAWSAS